MLTTWSNFFLLQSTISPSFPEVSPLISLVFVFICFVFCFSPVIFWHQEVAVASYVPVPPSVVCPQKFCHFIYIVDSGVLTCGQDRQKYSSSFDIKLPPWTFPTRSILTYPWLRPWSFPTDPPPGGQTQLPYTFGALVEHWTSIWHVTGSDPLLMFYFHHVDRRGSLWHRMTILKPGSRFIGSHGRQ